MLEPVWKWPGDCVIDKTGEAACSIFAGKLDAGVSMSRHG